MSGDSPAPTRRRIAIVGPYPPLRGGIAQFDERLHVHLEKAGHRVIGVSWKRQYPAFLFPGSSQYVTEPGERLATERIDSIGPASWRGTAVHIIQEGAEEAVLTFWMPFFAPALSTIASRLAKAGIRVTGLVHNARPHERQPFGAMLTRRFFNKCDRLIALSPTVARDIRASGVRQEVLVQPHPVYDQFGESIDRTTARRELGLAPDERILLFFGLIRSYKGLDVLIDAFASLAAKDSRLKLVVAGEFYEDEKAIDDRVQKAGLTDRVHFTRTYVPDSKVAVYFSAADVVVQPYRSATQSGVVQTAFQFGCPVIVTGVGALGEMVTDGEDALVVPPEDPVALAGAIRTFFSGDTADHLARGAARARNRWTWDEFVRVFE